VRPTHVFLSVHLDFSFSLYGASQNLSFLSSPLQSPYSYLLKVVIPVQTGIQNNWAHMDSCFRRNDKEWQIFNQFIFYVISNVLNPTHPSCFGHLNIWIGDYIENTFPNPPPFLKGGKGGFMIFMIRG
jgi:hypothetical protein